MFWENEDEYTIIEEISVEELQEFLNKNHISLSLDDTASRWAGFSNYYARQHGLNDLESASFSAITSTFMAGMGVSAGTEYYYNEENIENNVLDIYNSISAMDNLTETEKKQLLFKKIFKLYKEDIEEYELKTHNLNFRVTEKQYQKFMSFPGEGKTDKFLNLLNGVDKNE